VSPKLCADGKGCIHPFKFRFSSAVYFLRGLSEGLTFANGKFDWSKFARAHCDTLLNLRAD
jgi:hypothetical protein